jgi:hypothetical protein
MLEVAAGVVLGSIILALMPLLVFVGLVLLFFAPIWGVALIVAVYVLAMIVDWIR